uniref:RNase H domain-containing protein n=1 Tax=Bursaphelenchus xylophilus TaxID=6326 RepID=A0A1I7RJI7_BURXY
MEFTLTSNEWLWLRKYWLFDPFLKRNLLIVEVDGSIRNVNVLLLCLPKVEVKVDGIHLGRPQTNDRALIAQNCDPG